MSVNQVIEDALSSVSENIWPLKCPDASPPDKYIVYNSDIDTPGYYADDTDEEWVQHMQIHLYTKFNFIADRKEIRERLRSAGFTMTAIETFEEKGSGYHHLCFECYIEEEA